MGFLHLTIVSTLLAAPAAAQSINMRYTDWTPLPSPTYGAAIAQAGVWNGIETPDFSPPFQKVTPLVDLAGGGTSASAATSGCYASLCQWPGYGDDVENFFAGMIHGDCYAEPSSTLLWGMVPGSYVLTAYPSPCIPWPNNPPVTFKLSDLSNSASLTLSGKYEGSFETMTLGTFAFDLNAGVGVHITGWGLGYLSALQLTLIEPPAVYCTSKVNSQGCAAKIAAIGNEASLSGMSPFHLIATDVVNDVPGLLFYGFAEDIKPFMGGVHCVQPPTPRTWGQFSGGDGVVCGGTFDLDFNAWLAGDPTPKVYAGTKLHAQYWYRDVNDPHGAATSDAVSFHVVP
jgi:hypothetical protein